MAPLPPPPVFNWTGFYIGGNLGGGWASGTLSDSFTGASISASKSGFIGGGQLGGNYQIGAFVLGAEWDFDWTSLNGSGSAAGVSLSANTNWVTTLAGRFGVAVNNWLIYGKAGGGWVNNSATLTAAGGSITGSNTNAGWLAGGGVEYGLTPNWTIKAEYDYLGLNAWTLNPTFIAVGDRFSVNRQINMFTVGFNYKF